MEELSRRKTILGLASMGTIAVSGCLTRADDERPGDGDDTDDTGNGDGSDENGTDDDENNDGDGTEIVDVSIETIATDCASPDDDALDVDFGEDTITLSGVTLAPNPCHDAVLKDTDLDGDRLSVVVDVEDSSGEDNCIQCHGKVEYEARIDVEDASAIDAVHVDHVAGESHSVDRDDTKTGDEDGLTIDSVSIETLDTGCSSGDDDSVQVDPGDEEIVIDGVLPASTPCYEAIIEDVAVKDTKLSLVIDVASTLEDDEVCIECVGEVQYEAVVELPDADDVDSVHVDHATGGSHGVAWDEGSEVDEGGEGDQKPY